MIERRTLIVSMAGAGLVSSARAQPDQIMAPDWRALKHMPLSAVIANATIDDDVGLTIERTRADTAASIIARPEALRRLSWLAVLAHGWGRDGLHTFFFVSSGADYAPEIGQAMAESGLARQAAVFARAIALFGEPYPRDEKQRASHFAWSQPGRQVAPNITIPNEPNLFDRMMFELSREFGTLAEYWQALEALVEHSPALTGWADAQRAGIPDDQRMDWLTEQLAVAGPEDMARVIPGWPPAYRTLYLLDLFNDEMLNGGVHQFFFNSSGALAPDVAVALGEVGLPRHAAAVRRGIAQFRMPYPRDTGRRRDEYFRHKGTTRFDGALEALTKDVDDGAIGPAMVALAKRDGILPR